MSNEQECGAKVALDDLLGGNLGGTMDDQLLTMSMFATRREYEVALMKRDLNPHKSAKLAMWMWPETYAESGLGSMGFWDQLSDERKDYCRRCVVDVAKARD